MLLLQVIISCDRIRLQDEAKKNLNEKKDSDVSETVWAHWMTVAEGQIPYGYTVKAQL